MRKWSISLYLGLFPCSPLYLTADTSCIHHVRSSHEFHMHACQCYYCAVIFLRRRWTLSFDRRNLASDTRRGQNRPWELRTVIYGGVKNIRLKAGFYFLLSLHHTNNRLENAYIFFVPLQLNDNKKLLCRKNTGGAFAHFVHSMLCLWCHCFHETKVLKQVPAQGFRKKRVKRDGQWFMLIILHYLRHNTCGRDPWITVCFLNFCSQHLALDPHSGSARNMMALHASSNNSGTFINFF